MSKYTKFGGQSGSGILLVGFEVALGADQKALRPRNDKDVPVKSFGVRVDE